MSDIAKSLTKAVIAAEERAGTMPAKEAVKLRPSDWHTLCKTAREAADEITRLRQLLSEAETREREARVKALEDAALRVDAKANGYQVEARDVRRSERDRRFCASVADRLCGAAAAIRALQSEER